MVEQKLNIRPDLLYFTSKRLLKTEIVKCYKKVGFLKEPAQNFRSGCWCEAGEREGLRSGRLTRPLQFPTLTLGIQYCSVEIVHMMLRAWAVPNKIMKTNNNCFPTVHTCVWVFLSYVSKLEGYFGKTANIRKSKLLIICESRWHSERGKQILWIICVTLTRVTHKYN